MKKIETIEIPNPANHHVHLREGRMLEFTSFFSRLFSVVVAKANLKENPAVDAASYDKYYNQELRDYQMPQVIGGLMMTPQTTAETVEEAYRCGARFVANIPKGVSTNSNGILLTNLALTADQAAVCDCMSQLEIPLLLHVQNKFDENLSKKELDKFFKRIKLIKLIFPQLKISIEHVNLKLLIDFIYATPGVTGGIAPHYGLYTDNDVYSETGIILRPEIFCQPPYGDVEDQEAVIHAMADIYCFGERKFRYAPDDAPHSISAKKGNIPASGVFSGPVGLCVVAEMLEKIGRLEVMSDFMKYDEEFFNVPLDNPGKIMVLEKRKWTPPRIAQCGETPNEQVYLLKGGEKVGWQIV